MDFGFGVPTRGPLSAPQTLATLVASGEEMGFGYIGVADHIVVARRIDSTYPYSESGSFTGWESGECLEQLTLLAYLAARTTSIRLLSLRHGGAAIAIPCTPPRYSPP